MCLWRDVLEGDVITKDQHTFAPLPTACRDKAHLLNATVSEAVEIVLGLFGHRPWLDCLIAEMQRNNGTSSLFKYPEVLLGQTLKANIFLFLPARDANEVVHAAAEAIQPPRDKGTSLGQRLGACFQILVLDILAARGVGVEAVVADATVVQRVELQIEALVVCRDSGVPDVLSHWPVPAFQAKNVQQRCICWILIS